SVLIPIYNYNAFPLVETLHNQCMRSGIAFEIICIDDASVAFTQENKRIAVLPFCRVEYVSENSGRSRVRNALAQQAAYDWLLFLDADVLPDGPDFIQHYSNAMHGDADVVYGGLRYSDEKPSGESLLRWRYGKRREALSVKERRKRPYATVFFSNVLIRKQIFLQLTFNETLSGYGYEDFVFSTRLKAIDASVRHIQNPTYHLRLDTSAIFLEKTAKALQNLKFL
ncbi:MAG: glycosyltransferase family 2 protein, partial [Sinomicrobium sp.]|nr:glycosyltransferase family 2 protein [Sinomicrobium sp.]